MFYYGNKDTNFFLNKYKHAGITTQKKIYSKYS